MIYRHVPRFMLVLGAWFLQPCHLQAADFNAGPSDYTTMVSSLQPGDTLHLAAGTYEDLFYVSDLNGTEEGWITITGPESGEPAVFTADPGPCCNTIEIIDSSYVILRNLTVDGTMVDGAFGLSAKDGQSNHVHNITVENCTFIHHDTSQQNVAVSTKTPTWGWIIRGNVIDGAGTGMYLGNSDGTCPFIGGLVENNLVMNTIGYNVQIKWQQPRPAVEGLPQDPQRTIIRNNVFIKDDRPSEDGDRPNLLVGGFPDGGPGAQDIYEIYGNFFYHNPRESLVQASGRVSIHDNIFIDVTGTAILLQDHDLPLKLAYVYNNTIYSAGRGIAFGSAAREGDAVVGNLVFAGNAITGSIADQRDNMVDTIANAGLYVASPSLTLGEMNFYPLAGRCRAASMDFSKFTGDIDYNYDFNGTDKGDFTYRGAYAGDGDNPGWQLDAARKGQGPHGIPDEGPDSALEDPGVEPAADAAADRSGDDAAPPDAQGEEGGEGGSGGCGCRIVR